ncbi:MAG: hypothetical protein QOF65_2773 [Thermoleophilaceae bacterium]|nr:hypothetical protein [Thermoleophilaceae bacterium]
MATQRDRSTAPAEEDNLERARRAIERLDAISFTDVRRDRPPPRAGDGPLVRAARKLERLLGISS